MRLKKDKSGDTVGRPSWKSSLLGDPGAKFFCGKPQHMKNSLNFASTCLKVVDTRRNGLCGSTAAWVIVLLYAALRMPRNRVLLNEKTVKNGSGPSTLCRQARD